MYKAITCHLEIHIYAYVYTYHNPVVREENCTCIQVDNPQTNRYFKEFIKTTTDLDGDEYYRNITNVKQEYS
jgi:hypothetical protein